MKLDAEFSGRIEARLRETDSAPALRVLLRLGAKLRAGRDTVYGFGGYEVADDPAGTRRASSMGSDSMRLSNNFHA